MRGLVHSSMKMRAAIQVGAACHFTPAWGSLDNQRRSSRRIASRDEWKMLLSPSLRPAVFLVDSSEEHDERLAAGGSEFRSSLLLQTLQWGRILPNPKFDIDPSRGVAQSELRSTLSSAVSFHRDSGAHRRRDGWLIYYEGEYHLFCMFDKWERQAQSAQVLGGMR